jgi:ribonuclease HI
VLQASLDIGEFPDLGRESITVVLRKPGRATYAESKSYRPIALLNTLSKVMSAAVANMLSYVAERYHLLPKNHFGGRPGRTTTDALQYLVTKIKDAWSRKRMVGVLFLDIEGAFPNANPEKLVHNLKMRRVPEKIVNYVESMLVGRKTKLRFDDYQSDYFTLTNGIGQGCPLSMILYIFYNADFLEIPMNKNEDVIGFVDDTACLVEGEDETEIGEQLKDMMERDGGGLEWCREQNSKLCLSKTTYVLATQRRDHTGDPQTGPRTTPITRTSITIDNILIPPSPYAKYLGIFIDQELRWKEQSSRAISKATNWVLAYRRLAKQNKGVALKVMRRLYSGVAIPKMLYAADVWLQPPTKKENGKRRIGAVSTVRRLASVQRIATLAITGALRSTSTVALDGHANLLPMHLSAKKICHRALLRMACLPEEHPIAPIIRRISRRNRVHHMSPIHRLLKMFPDIVPEKLEKIPAIGQPPWSTSPLTTKIAKSREDAVRRAIDIPDTHAYRVYTDGSGLDGQAGASAVLYRYFEEIASLRYYLGPLSQHTVYEAEGVAATMGLHLLQTRTRGTKIEGKVDLGIDNQAVIQADFSGKPRPGSHILQRMHVLADRVKRKMKKPHHLRMTWVPGHEDIEGNERADELAKSAAEGFTSPASELPAYLRRHDLPANKSAIQQAFGAAIREEWNEECKALHIFRRLHAADPTMPSNNFLKIASKCTRPQASLLIQLRTGRIGLNRHLHQLSQADDPFCPHCPHVEETVRHLLLECPKYWKERLFVQRRLRRKAFDMKTLLSDPKAIHLTLKFVAQTRRLEDSYGDTLKK